MILFRWPYQWSPYVFSSWFAIDILDNENKNCIYTLRPFFFFNQNHGSVYHYVSQMTTDVFICLNHGPGLSLSNATFKTKILITVFILSWVKGRFPALEHDLPPIRSTGDHPGLFLVRSCCLQFQVFSAVFCIVLFVLLSFFVVFFFAMPLSV